MNLGSHPGFIVAAYVAAIVVIGGLIAWVMLDYSAQRHTLDQLEARGVRRRSTRARS